MTTTARLQELLDQLQGGKESARDALLEYSLGRVHFLAQKMFRRQADLRSLVETGDVLNEAMLRLHRALLDVRPPDVAAFCGLAATHIRWVLCDLAREKNRKSAVAYIAEPEEPASSTDEPSDLLEWAEFHERIEGLPTEEKAVFEVLFYQGLEQAEAAELLGVPLRTLKRRWQHARLTLSDAMQGRMPGEAS